MIKSAILDGHFRYFLMRLWDLNRPLACFVMLNPSVADHRKDDPTIKKCIGFCERWDFGGFVVVNQYAYVATKPKGLKAAGYPIGARNDYWIARAARHSEMIICAWGGNAQPERSMQVLKLLRDRGHKPMALRVNGDGTPGHPLYLPYSCQPREMTPYAN